MSKPPRITNEIVVNYLLCDFSRSGTVPKVLVPTRTCKVINTLYVPTCIQPVCVL